MNTAVDQLTGGLLKSYLGDERAKRISHRYLPSREGIVEISAGGARSHVSGLLRPRRFEPSTTSRRMYRGRRLILVPKLEREIEHCLCYGREREEVPPALGECAPKAHELAQIFLKRLPQIRGSIDWRCAGGFRWRSGGA